MKIAYAAPATWATCVVDGVPTFKCFEIIVQNIINISVGLFLFALFVMFIIGAFNYLTSMGNEEKMKKAQATFKFAIIGLILFISSYLILKIVGFLFLQDPNAIFNFELPGP